MRSIQLLGATVIVIALAACEVGGESTPATPITGPLTGATYVTGVGDVNLDMLIVNDAASEEVAAAAEKLGGWLFHSSGATQHQVRLPVDSIDELDVARAALEAEGFEVEYMVVGRLN